MESTVRRPPVGSDAVLEVAILKSMTRMLIKNYKQISPPTKQSAELTCRI